MKTTLAIGITVKCSDKFSALLINGMGNQVGDGYDGYVPDWMPGNHFGDYLELNIDIETGRVLNWKRPTIAALKKTFGDFEI